VQLEPITNHDNDQADLINSPDLAAQSTRTLQPLTQDYSSPISLPQLVDPHSPSDSLTPTVKMAEALLFNSHSGYLEGVIRGFKAGLLSHAQYSNLTQCETLDGQSPPRPRTEWSLRSASARLTKLGWGVCFSDFKMQLTATDYGNFLSNETPPIATSTISERATARLVDEFNYIKSNSVQPLTKFLDYITYAYMIDNVSTITAWQLQDAREPG